METEAQWNPTSARSFYLEQLKIVRAEADKLADETRVTERFVLGACGGIYTFVLARWDYFKNLPGLFILAIPFLLAVWGGLRCTALYVRIGQCAEFLRMGEMKLSVKDWIGWEQWLIHPVREEHFIANSAKAIWLLLIVGTFVICLGAFAAA